MKLKIPLISNLLEHRGRRQLRRIMRGYRYLKESNNLNLITEVKEALTNTHLKDVSTHASIVIFGAAITNAELVIRQYLLLRLVGVNLNKSLLYALGKPGSLVFHPLPYEWRKVIEQQGFKVAKIHSVLTWWGFVIMMLIYGIGSAVKQTLKSINALVLRPYRSPDRYAYFDSLTSGNLPQPCDDGQSHDIITWYMQWPGRVPDLDRLCHSVKGIAPLTVEDIPVISIQSGIIPLTWLSAIIHYIGICILAIIIAIVDLLRGRWWHAFLLSEASKAILLRMQNPEQLAKDYLFHNSNWIYRPLWTYEAEKKGSRIAFYFYSTNCESFKRPDAYPIQANSWQAMNWPCYLLWDEYQADFVRRAIGRKGNISVVGPIWFQTSVKELHPLPQKSIAIFDIQPHRDSRYQILGAEQEYYTPKTANQFLLDIYLVIKEFEAMMVLKRKRNIGSLLNRRYVKVLEKLSNLDHFIAIDTDISAIRVIEKCAAVISMPFTSTALLGRELGKPSIYYDPHGIIQKDDRAAHGIPIVSGIDELKNWFATISEL